MTDLFAKDGCEAQYFQGQERPTRCPHGEPLLTDRQRATEERKLEGGRDRQVMGAGSGGPSNSRLRVPNASGATADYATGQPPSRLRRTKGLKRGRGFAASKEQQRATKGRACIVCGKDEAEAIIDPAHVTPRRMAPHCTCEKGTVPLCREHHEAYDQLGGGFDLLPYLMAHGLFEETVHGFLEHGVSLREVMDVVTGTKWAPIPHLEAHPQETEALK